MKKTKVIVSFSGGKDSTLALYRMIKMGYEVIALLVTFDGKSNSCFHKIPKNIFNDISTVLNIPLMEVNCGDENNYEKEFENTLKKAKEKGAELCVFGDIDIENHKKWGIDRCTIAGINAEFPLWQESREDLVNEFVECGFRAVIKKVQLELLGEEFLGKELNQDVINNMKILGIDPSGENGEYHTLVFDGPIFNEEVKFQVVEKEIIDKYGYLTII